MRRAAQNQHIIPVCVSCALASTGQYASIPSQYRGYDSQPRAPSGEANAFLFFVTFVATGWSVELPIDVAFLAVDLFVVFVQYLPGNRVSEAVRFPITVAVVADRAWRDERDVLVAFATATALVVSAQRPSGVCVVEGFDRRLALLPMTSPAFAGDLRGALIHVRFMAA